MLDAIWAPPRPRAPDHLFTALPDLAPLLVHLAAWRLRAQTGELDTPEDQDASWPDAAAIRNYLACPTGELPACHVPHLAEAAARLKLAVERRETVGVYGDYDVDGVTSAALLMSWLRGLGVPVETLLPRRDVDGYGLSVAALEHMAARGCRVVIAVDCGMTAVIEAERARQLGVELLVLDHHAPGPTLPDVALMVSPQLPGADAADRCLAAVGLAYRLCEAMVLAGVGERRTLDAMLDLVALGTIADVSALTGQNRQLVARGLLALQACRRPGVLALAAAARVSPARLTSAEVAFRLAPRLNAAGRLSDPRLAYELLTTDDPGRAAVLASELDQLNRQRQTLMEIALAAALTQLGAVNGLPKVLVAAGDGWHPGVVGLVAGKLAERFHRPALALTATATGYIGSARSVDGFDIALALHACRDLLLTGGGHSRAAGLSLETASLAPLQQRLQELADQQLGVAQMRPRLTADARVRLATLKPELLHALELLGPFGEGNPPPLLQADGVSVVGIARVGKERQHLQVRFRQGNAIRKAVQFNAEPGDVLPVGGRVDILFVPQLDVFNGAERVELRVAAMRPSAG